MIAWLLACRPAPEPPTAPSDYVRPADEPAPSLDEAGVAAAATGALAWFFAADPGDAIDAWSEAATAGDGVCPYYTPGGDGESFYWYGTCATEGGATFDGSLYGAVYVPFDDEAWTYWDYAAINGEARIVLSDGEQFRFAGELYAYKQRALVGAATAGFARWIGDASWEGGARGDSWLGAAPSFDYELIGNDDGYGGRVVTVDGGASNLPGTFGAIVFDDVTVDLAVCGAEPAGLLRFAEASGEWYELAFDDTPCDGCAQVWFRGAPIGEACPDLAPLVTYAAGWSP